jgi:hypothetical protein
MRKFILAGGFLLGSLVATSQPTLAGQTVDRCWTECRGLLTAGYSPRRTQIYFHNCYVICHNRGHLICPGGITVNIRRGTCPTPWVETH